MKKKVQGFPYVQEIEEKFLKELLFYLSLGVNVLVIHWLIGEKFRAME